MSMEKRVRFICIWVSIAWTAQTALAQNLLPNPGFESNSGCPSFVAQMYLATGWNNPSGHSGSADYIHTCGTNAWVQIPSNAFGSQAAHGGNAYMGLALFYQSTPEFREYIYCQLTPPSGLTAGTSYQINWYVSCADNSSRATNSLQYYLSAAAPTWAASNWNAMTTYTPQCSIPPATFITDKANWVQVSATFTAAGGERFLTVGNFRTDASTSTVANGGGSYTTGYVYFDDGVLQPTIILSADVVDLRAEEMGESVRLQWATLSETANASFEIERSAGDYHHFEKVGERKGAGNSTEQLEYAFDDHGFTPGVVNYYRLKVVDQNGEATHSNAVGVATTPRGEHLVNFFPNPSFPGTPIAFTFSLDRAQSVHALLLDVQGRVVRERSYEGHAGANHFQFDTDALAPGQYLMRINSGNVQAIRRIHIL